MATTTSTITKDQIKESLAKIKRLSVGGMKLVETYLVEVTYALATTEIDNADDSVNILTFPDEELYLWDLSVDVDDLDTNVTPAHVFNLSLSGGTVLITGSTAGQGGTVDEMDAGVAKGISVSGQTLVFDTTTAAATPAAGNVVIRMVLFGRVASVTE